MPYHITIFDMFHPGDEDAAWDGGTYVTAAAAIASVKCGVDNELERFWAQEVAAGGTPTVQSLVSDIHYFAELPVAFGPDYRPIFDSEAYAAERAAEMVAGIERTSAVAPASVTSAEPSRRSARSSNDVRDFLIVIIGSLLLLVVSALLR